MASKALPGAPPSLGARWAAGAPRVRPRGQRSAAWPGSTRPSLHQTTYPRPSATGQTWSPPPNAAGSNPLTTTLKETAVTSSPTGGPVLRALRYWAPIPGGSAATFRWALTALCAGPPDEGCPSLWTWSAGACTGHGTQRYASWRWSTHSARCPGPDDADGHVTSPPAPRGCRRLRPADQRRRHPPSAAGCRARAGPRRAVAPGAAGRRDAD